MSLGDIQDALISFISHRTELFGVSSHQNCTSALGRGTVLGLGQSSILPSPGARLRALEHLPKHQESGRGDELAVSNLVWLRFF